MNFSTGRTRKRLKAVEITPMIDVVFLLIIFFMTTARFAQDTKADLDLPLERGAQEEESAEAGLVINLARDGSVIIDGDVVDHDGIINRVQAEVAQSRGRSAAGVALTIRADRGAPAESLNKLVTILQELGLGGARIATEVP